MLQDNEDHLRNRSASVPQNTHKSVIVKKVNSTDTSSEIETEEMKELSFSSSNFVNLKKLSQKPKNFVIKQEISESDTDSNPSSHSKSMEGIQKKESESQPYLISQSLNDIPKKNKQKSKQENK